jgi:hypothetical protein
MLLWVLRSKLSQEGTVVFKLHILVKSVVTVLSVISQKDVKLIIAITLLLTFEVALPSKMH